MTEIDRVMSDEGTAARLTAAQKRREELIRAIANDMIACLSSIKPVIHPSGLLAGPVWLDGGAAEATLGHRLQLGADNFHFPMNLETLMKLGFAGIARTARANGLKVAGEAADYLMAIADTYDAVCSFVGAHAAEAERHAADVGGVPRERLMAMAETCRALTHGRPMSFRQGVQAFWFAWAIRRGGTIGRLDQALHSLYQADLAAGTLTRGEAFELLADLWRLINQAGRGDTLRNVMLGGCDREGRDATTDLSLLMVEVAIAVRDTEPHINLRVHADTPPVFLDKAIELLLLGDGQGTIFTDEVIIPALEKYGVPLRSARNYACDGCNEIIIDGESGISFFTMEAVKALEFALFNGHPPTLPGVPTGRYWNRHAPARQLHTSLLPDFESGDMADMDSFEQVYEAFWRQYAHQMERRLEGFSRDRLSEREQGVTNPFLAGTFPQSLESGIDPFRGGFTVDCNVVFSGTLTTVADALAALKKVVFAERACTMKELLDALRADFTGYETLRQRLLNAPKFGNDDDFVDSIASDLVRRFCALVRGYPTPSGRPYWPALFNHTFNDEAQLTGATPDGRRWGYPIAEHFSPTPGRARKGPTAVIRSVAKAPLNEAVGTAVFHLSISRNVVPRNTAGHELLRSLIQTAMNLGVPVMNVAIYDVVALREAQKHPEQYGDLLVRVWGYSARFVDLDEAMQNHIVARTVGDI